MQDCDGESHFEEVESEFIATDYVQSAPALDLCEIDRAAKVGFMRAPAGWTSDFHVSPGRSLFVALTGEWDITASDGESRRFKVGSTLLVEDTSGKGHASRVVSYTASVAVIVQLPEKST